MKRREIRKKKMEARGWEHDVLYKWCTSPTSNFVDWNVEFEIVWDMVYLKSEHVILMNQFINYTSMDESNIEKIAVLFLIHLPVWMRYRGIGTRIVNTLEERVNKMGFRLAVGPLMGGNDGLIKIMTRKNYVKVPPFSLLQPHKKK